MLVILLLVSIGALAIVGAATAFGMFLASVACTPPDDEFGAEMFQKQPVRKEIANGFEWEEP